MAKFQKGQSGNPGGRPKDLVEIQRLAREKSAKALETLEKIMLDPQTPAPARVSAARELLDRGWGKALQPTKEIDDQTYKEFLKQVFEG